MNEKEYSDDELEEELDKTFKISEKKPNVFRIIRNEKDALNMKDKRRKLKLNLIDIKIKFKIKKEMFIKDIIAQY